MNSTLPSGVITVFLVNAWWLILSLLCLLTWGGGRCGQGAASRLRSGTPKLTLQWRKGQVSEYWTPGVMRALPFSRNGQIGDAPSPEGQVTGYLRAYAH